MIDAHIHLYPADVCADPRGWALNAGEAQWMALATRRRKSGHPVQTFPSVKDTLSQMDRDGVELAFLMGWYWQTAGQCRIQNRFYAQCVHSHPDRFRAFATVIAASDNSPLEEIRWAKSEGFLGLGELSPHSQGAAVREARWLEILGLAQDLGFAVNFHVSDPGGKSHPGKVDTPLADFLWVAEQFPRIPIILSHWGGRLPLVEKCEIPTNIYYDTAASPLLYERTIWPEMIAAVGAERILFGTDFPLILFPNTERDPTFVSLAAEARLSGIGKRELELIFRENASRAFALAARSPKPTL